MGIRIKAIARWGGKSFLIPFGTKAISCFATAVPDVPVGTNSGAPSVTVKSSSSLQVNWNADPTGFPENLADRYEIQRSATSSSGPWTTIAANVNPADLLYVDTGLSASTKYWYQLRAVNCFGSSAYTTTEISATTQSATPTAAWTLDFSSGEPWANGTNYTYSSLRTAGTYVASSGYIAPNAANFTTYSEDFTQTTPWGLNGMTSPTANSGTSPDGTNTAFLLTEAVGTGVHRIGLNTNINGLTAASPHTVSVYVKKSASGGVDYAHIALFYNSTVNSTCWTIVNLNNGNIETTDNGGHTNVSARTVNAGNGWYRLILTGTPPAGGSVARIGVGAATQTAISYSVSSGNAKTLLAWGAQIVNGSEPLPYSKTTTASNGIPRLTHNSSGSRLGLLVEGQRTNEITRSADWSTGWTLAGLTQTANAATSPLNTTTATRIVETSATSVHETYQIPTLSNAVFSCYLKAGQRTAATVALYRGTNNWTCCTFDLSAGTAGAIASGTSNSYTNTSAGIEAAGNGWYRCWIRGDNSNGITYCVIALNTTPTPTRQATNGQENYAGNTANGIFVWGAQAEGVNSPPSSIIPTTGSAVTRSADLAHVLDSSITSWGNPGALVVHFYPPGQAGTLISTDDAATAQVGIEASTTTAARAFWSSGSTATGTIGTGVQKAVHYWNGTNSRFCINAGTVQTGTNNFTIANADFVTLGAESTESGGNPNQNPYTQYSNCIIRKVEFYSGTLTDTQLQAVTT